MCSSFGTLCLAEQPSFSSLEHASETWEDNLKAFCIYTYSLLMPAPVLNGLDEAQVAKAAQSLLKYAAKREQSSTNLLQEEEMIYLVSEECVGMCTRGDALVLVRDLSEYASREHGPHILPIPVTDGCAQEDPSKAPERQAIPPAHPPFAVQHRGLRDLPVCQGRKEGCVKAPAAQGWLHSVSTLHHSSAFSGRTTLQARGTR